MSQFTAKQRSQIPGLAGAASALTPALRAQLATAAQGLKADTALQNAALFATFAQGQKADTALQNAALFATFAQGQKADSALQSADIAGLVTKESILVDPPTLTIPAGSEPITEVLNGILACLNSLRERGLI